MALRVLQIQDSTGVQETWMSVIEHAVVVHIEQVIGLK